MEGNDDEGKLRLIRSVMREARGHARAELLKQSPELALRALRGDQGAAEYLDLLRKAARAKLQQSAREGLPGWLTRKRCIDLAR